MDGHATELGKRLVVYLTTMLLSLTVHEYAHAFVADRLGDDTPRRQGRLTLSPLEHYDIWGTFLIPIVALLVPGGIPFFGWARPVETVPSNYTRKISMRTGHRLVAAAGPLSNLLLAVIATALLAVFGLDETLRTTQFAAQAGTLSGTIGAFAFLLVAFVQVNIGLFVLNLLPVPPLDGSRLLPRSMDDFQNAIAPYSFFIMLVILNVRQLRLLFYWPVGIIGAALQSLFGVNVGLA